MHQVASRVDVPPAARRFLLVTRPWVRKRPKWPKPRSAAFASHLEFFHSINAMRPVSPVAAAGERNGGRDNLVGAVTYRRGKTNEIRSYHSEPASDGRSSVHSGPADSRGHRRRDAG